MEMVRIPACDTEDAIEVGTLNVTMPTVGTIDWDAVCQISLPRRYLEISVASTEFHIRINKGILGMTQGFTETALSDGRCSHKPAGNVTMPVGLMLSRQTPRHLVES